MGGSACLAGHAADGEQKARPRPKSTERRSDGCGFVAFCAVAVAASVAATVSASVDVTAAAVSHSRRMLLTMVMAKRMAKIASGHNQPDH